METALTRTSCTDVAPNRTDSTTKNSHYSTQQLDDFFQKLGCTMSKSIGNLSLVLENSIRENDARKKENDARMNQVITQMTTLTKLTQYNHVRLDVLGSKVLDMDQKMMDLNHRVNNIERVMSINSTPHKKKRKLLLPSSCQTARITETDSLTPSEAVEAVDMKPLVVEQVLQTAKMISESPDVTLQIKATSSCSETTLALLQQAPAPLTIPKIKLRNLDPSHVGDKDILHVLLLVTIGSFWDTSISHYTYYPFKGNLLGFFSYALMDVMNKIAARFYCSTVKKTQFIQYISEWVDQEEGNKLTFDLCRTFQEVSPYDVVHRGQRAAYASGKRKSSHPAFKNNVEKSIFFVHQSRIEKLCTQKTYLKQAWDILKKYSLLELRRELPPRKIVHSKKELDASPNEKKANLNWLLNCQTILADNNARNCYTIMPYPTSWEIFLHRDLDFDGFFASGLFKCMGVKIPDKWTQIHYTYRLEPLESKVTPFEELRNQIKMGKYLHCRALRPTRIEEEDSDLVGNGKKKKKRKARS